MASAKKLSFLKDVEHEIKMLKEHATPEEISKLNFEKFDSTSKQECIYGQMTGTCQSTRAKELMDKSCVKVMCLKSGTNDIKEEEIESERFNINGEYNGQTWKHLIKDGNNGIYGRSWEYLSALEGYICSKDAKVEHIIQYLKGEVEELNLLD